MAVILSPSPMPPMLWVLTLTLLKAGYVVLVAVPHVDDAEALEKRLAPLEEKSGLRVLIYDPEDVSAHPTSDSTTCSRQSTTFPPFHRSLLATLTLRFPATHSQSSGDPYNPQPTHVPHVHAFISLYPLHPAPPSQPNALPALPTLLSPDNNGRTPMLVTLYPSGSMLVQPDSFASQILTANHRLLGENLAAFSSARIVSVYVGHLNLPPLHQLLSNARILIHRLTFTERWRISSTYEKLFVVKDAALHGAFSLYSGIFGVAGRAGFGSSAKDYKHFERQILRILKSNRRAEFSVGQYSRLPFFLSHLSPWILAPLLRVLPTLPGATGPLNASVQGLPAPRKPLSSAASATTSTSARKSANAATDSASSSDHESGEDLASSLHSLHSTRSGVTASSRGESSESGMGMEDSWAHLDAST